MKVNLYRSSSGRSPVEDFISNLSKEDQALFKTIHDGIELEGLKYPYVIFKPLEGKLWEIKFKGLDGSYRIAYVLVTGPKMFWLHLFKKKTQKISRLDFELAWKRMKEILEYEKNS
jgi:phage-related protein